MSKSVVVVGAGISGLVCARKLHQVGMNVTVVDANPTIGGRVRTEVVDEFRLDMGFQVYFTAYPSTQLELNTQALNLKTFEPGCLVWDGNKTHEIHKDGAFQAIFERYLPLPDLLRLGSLSLEVKEMSDEDVWNTEETTILNFLKQRGFSDKAINRFFRPFFGGVMLNRNLDDSSRAFLYYFRMLDKGQTTIPALGMGEITNQIAGDIPQENFRLNQKVTKLNQENDYITGVTLASGEIIQADATILAVDPNAISALTNLPTNPTNKSCVTIHFSADSCPIDDPILVVNNVEHGRINHVAPMSKVSPALAPAGRHLISATILGNPQEDDLYLAKAARYELSQWFPNHNVNNWLPLAVHRIPHAQMDQKPGFLDNRPPTNPQTGLYLASEACTYAGLDGAVKAAHAATSAVLAWFKERVSA